MLASTAMAPAITERKRKASPKAAAESDDELVDGLLEGVLSQSEDDSDYESVASELGEEESEPDGGEDDDESLGSDDVPSDADEDGVRKKLREGPGDGEGNRRAEEDAEDEERPNYTVTTDANGGIRYVYDEIDPVYDSDDTDVQEVENTIGDIPLSFYDSYPHIGYDINGKKIMRPATGEALDALLDSIEVPKGWTGLTDPATGKPLNLSQDELELLRRVQMNEIPEEGYDPYPVRQNVECLQKIAIAKTVLGYC